LNSLIETDVAVVGGGLAGLSAAGRAAGLGARVTLLDKARAGSSGLTAFSAGGILCWVPGQDSLGDWVQSFLEAGEGLNSRAWVTRFLEGNYRQLESLESRGYPFLKDGEGHFIRHTGPGPQNRHLIAPMRRFQEKNRQECQSLGVNIIDRCCIAVVLTQGGRAAGVAGFDVYTGKVTVVLAPAVVICSGGCSYRGPHFGQDVVSGEGLAMAMEAGARLAFMEYGNHYGVSLACFDTCGQSEFLSRGGKYVNGLGQFFLEGEGKPGRRAAGNAAVKAMVDEVSSGRGPIYMDLTAFRQQRPAWELMPNLKAALDRSGIDIFADRHEVIPAFTGASSASPAGIWIDGRCRSSLAGLFAAGDCACKGPVTGSCVGIPGIGLAWANYTGHLAGRSAANYAGSAEAALYKPELSEISRQLLLPLGREFARRPGAILRELGEEMSRVDVSLVRSSTRLVSALGKVSTWRWELENYCGAGDLHELVTWYEAKSALAVAEATLLAAMERRESRGGHYREDYPEKSPHFELALAVEDVKGVRCVLPLSPAD